MNRDALFLPAGWRRAVRHRLCRLHARLAPGRPPSVYDEMRAGSLTGLFACPAFAAAVGASAAWLAAAAGLGGCVGAVLGLVLWSGSAALPEDPVLPPHPSQRRRR
jgi:hypothetical protein